MLKKYYFAAALVFSFLIMPLPGLAGPHQNGEITGPAGGAALAVDWRLPAGYQILDVQAADVTGDKIPDRVYLIAHKPAAASGYADSIRLIVEDGATKKRTETAMAGMGGYEACLFLGDFTGDRLADALVTAASGGSGGWYDNRVVTFTNKEAVIFDQQDNGKMFVAGRFKDGFKVEFYQEAGTGSAVTLDVSERKADYLRLGLYDQDGTLRQETGTMVTPFGRLEPVDVNHDGIYELKGRQRIAGAYNADGLATVETVLAYNGQEWEPRSVSLHINLPPAAGSSS